MEDKQVMSVALELAKQSNPSPNPKVGCIIVKNGRIISSGYHKRAGEEHAEISALNKLENGDATGAIMYTTLEPCSHNGEDKKTPPCIKTILESGISRVICAMKDPNPRVKGLEQLRRHGIAVEVGVLEEEAEGINQAYVKHMRKKMPFVSLKAASTLDGKIATETGDSKWISSPESREFVHKLRSEHDAIMVGINTALKDDPELTCRLPKDYYVKQPLKIIIDSKLRIPINAKLFRNADRNSVIIACAKNHIKGKFKKLQKRAEIIVCGDRKVDLKRLMLILAKRNITSILLEGGSELNAGMLEKKLVDRMYLFIAPKIIGGRNAVPLIGGEGIKKLMHVKKIRDMKVRRIGEDILVDGYF